MLDGFAALAFSSSLGLGVAFSVVPTLIYQGGISLLAAQVQALPNIRSTRARRLQRLLLGYATPLELDGNGTSPQVQRFLDAGLNTSFSDYPLPTGLPLPAGLNLPGRSKTTPVTPFDGDIGPVIDYLESKMENDDDLRRP